MKRRSILSVSATIALGLAFFAITAGSTAKAAEIKLLSAVALQPGFIALIPDFEKTSGHKVTTTYGTAGAVAGRVQKGEAADIVINAGPLIDQLQAQGKVVADSRVTPLCCTDRQADVVSVTSFVVRRSGHTPAGRVRACDLAREQRRPPQSRDAAPCVSATHRRSRA